MSVDERILSYEISEHYKNEAETLKFLLQLEIDFRQHYQLYQKEIEKQKELIDRLWLLSQRYLVLTATGPCCKNPEVYTQSAEETLLKEYQEKLEAIRVSNNVIKQSIVKLRPLFLKFRDSFNRLDKRMETAFMLGDTFHRPIKYFNEMVDDIFKYFYAGVLKLKYRMHQLDPIELKSIEEYKILLLPCEEFEEYLFLGLTYCKCLQQKPTCPKKALTKPCQKAAQLSNTSVFKPIPCKQRAKEASDAPQPPLEE